MKVKDVNKCLGMNFWESLIIHVVLANCKKISFNLAGTLCIYSNKKTGVQTLLLHTRKLKGEKRKHDTRDDNFKMTEPESNVPKRDHPDILQRLWNSFSPPASSERAQELQEFQDEIKKRTYKNIKEEFIFKSMKGILAEKFEEFVKNIAMTYRLDNEAKERLLDGLYGQQNDDKIAKFEFNDGKGNVYHGRFITAKKNGKVDVAYAIYTMTFELPEKVSDKDWCFKYWFYVLPVGWEYKRQAQELSEDEKQEFNKWCKAKLCNSVAEERGNQERQTDE